MDFRLPELGEGVYEAEMVRWLVAAGDRVRRGQGLMEVLTDKATMEVPAPFNGVITGLRAEPGQRLKVGDVILTYDPQGAAAAAATGAAAPPRPKEAAAAAAPAAAAPPARRGARPHAGNGAGVRAPAAAPSVRHLARKMGIDLAQVRGSGPGGRILLDDVTALIRARPGGPEAPAAPSPADVLDLGVAGTRVKLHGVRRRIAEHMVAAKRTIPHYSYVDECDVTELVRLRESLREPLAKRGVKLTYLAFFVKAAALALKEVPIVNSSLDEEAGEIVLHDHCHVGVAVATHAGLIVPVVRDADRKDLLTIAAEIERLGAEARQGKSRLEDLRGGTFTVTSVGGIGGLISAPIINHPEAAILGLGKVVKRPVYDAAGNLRPAEMIYLSFSFDHRVIDGAVGAAFGNAVIRHAQNPAAMLLPTLYVG